MKRACNAVIKDKGVQMVKPDADFELIATEYQKVQSAQECRDRQELRP